MGEKKDDKQNIKYRMDIIDYDITMKSRLNRIINICNKGMRFPIFQNLQATFLPPPQP